MLIAKILVLASYALAEANNKIMTPNEAETFFNSLSREQQTGLEQFVVYIANQSEKEKPSTDFSDKIIAEITVIGAQSASDQKK